MIGLATYRDYFATKQHGMSSKYEALCQYNYDLSEMLGEDIEIVPTAVIARPEETYAKYSKLIIFEHPTAFIGQSGTGFTTPNVDNHMVQLEKLFAFDGELVGCNLELQNWKKWIRNLRCRRVNPKTSFYNIPTEDELTTFFETILAKSLTSQLKDFRESRKHFAVGDSHATMLWKPGTTVKAIYGRTLFGALKRGLADNVPAHAESAIFCFGNIDLRHHMARQDDPRAAAYDLAREYIKQVEQLSCDVSVCELLPLIRSDRKVTKSYYFKEEPHYGSEQLRGELREIFNRTLREFSTRSSILRVPERVHGESGLLNEDALERGPSGIHLSPLFYEASASLKTTSKQNAWLP